MNPTDESWDQSCVFRFAFSYRKNAIALTWLWNLTWAIESSLAPWSFATYTMVLLFWMRRQEKGGYSWWATEQRGEEKSPMGNQAPEPIVTKQGFFPSVLYMVSERKGTDTSEWCHALNNAFNTLGWLMFRKRQGIGDLRRRKVLSEEVWSLWVYVLKRISPVNVYFNGYLTYNQIL